MSRRLEPWATALGFHKPDPRPPYRSDPCPEHGQGGSLFSSARESARDSGHSSPNRRTAVVGLVACPYGLPSTDPTTRPSAGVTRCVTPVPSLAVAPLAVGLGRHVPVAPTVLCPKCGWSAPADNRPRSEFPLDPLLSRGDRPLVRPSGFRTEDTVHLHSDPLLARFSAPRRPLP